MASEANNRRQAGWLFALSAAGYTAVVAYTVYLTDPFLFDLANNPPTYLQMLSVFCVPLIASATCAVLLLFRKGRSRRVNLVVLGIGIVTCAGLLLAGRGLYTVMLASPTALFAARMYRGDV